ncbi:BA75_05244T0 [Komagataella pastoris]|uniref:BA75_05244T0 n=1 Tax=Komagataella pastoris TaxID=4922 RepID=A0A1B2JIG9_PICPA|nr:BA75_05244T0 [Komagataella pastoris]
MVSIPCDLCLFDLDGTLVLSTKAIEKGWESVFSEYNVNYNMEEFLQNNHGVRTGDSFDRWLPQIDNTNSKAGDEFEKRISIEYADLAEPVPGAPQLLNSIPKDHWLVVTSGTPLLANGWFSKVLAKFGVTKPEIFVTGQSVSNGKPHPEPYLKGLALWTEKYGKKPVHPIVFEDAPNGIKAGTASGCTVIGIASSFGKEVLQAAGATYVVQDLSHVKFHDNTLDIDNL